ncbi:MAG: hypothetical protein EHM91_17270 [Planctomycetota bacterium]|nr:MAG: hypothetical protein EHM91_17270 [Planctomycetota bacterium]
MVPVSTYVPANIWIVGEAGPAWVAGMVLCNPDHSLEYQSCVYNSPGGGWAFVAPQPPDPQGCITIQGQNFSFDVPMVFPWRIATVTYHAAVDQSIDDLFLMGPEGGVLTDGGTVFFDNLDTVVGQVQIGITSVEETNWGAVKNLFR